MIGVDFVIHDNSVVFDTAADDAGFAVCTFLSNLSVLPWQRSMVNQRLSKKWRRFGPNCGHRLQILVGSRLSG